MRENRGNQEKGIERETKKKRTAQFKPFISIYLLFHNSFYFSGNSLDSSHKDTI